MRSWWRAGKTSSGDGSGALLPRQRLNARGGAAAHTGRLDEPASRCFRLLPELTTSPVEDVRGGDGRPGGLRVPDRPDRDCACTRCPRIPRLEKEKLRADRGGRARLLRRDPPGHRGAAGACFLSVAFGSVLCEGGSGSFSPAPSGQAANESVFLRHSLFSEI